MKWRTGVLGGAILLFVLLFVVNSDSEYKRFWAWSAVFAFSRLLWRLQSSDSGVDDSGSASTSKAESEPVFDGALMERVRFDATGWTFVAKDATSFRWRDEVGSVLGLQVIRRQLGPIEPDGDVVSYCRDNIRFGSSLVEARPVQAAFRGLACIEKRQHHAGYAYVGRLNVILEQRTVVLWTVAFEMGVTGLRESFVVAEALKEGRISLPAGAPSGMKICDWFADPYDPSRNDRTMCSVADDQKYDARFPNHPVSRVRRTLRQIEASFKLGSAVRDPGDTWPHPPLSVGDDRPATVH